MRSKTQTKILIALLLIIAISIAYYFVVFLPKEHQKQRELEVWKVKVSEETNPVRLLEQCLLNGIKSSLDLGDEICKNTPGCWDSQKNQIKDLTVIPDNIKDLTLKLSIDSENECYRKYKK